MKILIPESEITYSGYSVMDSFGKVFFWNGRVFRGLKDQLSIDKYLEIVNCGLLPALIAQGLFPITSISGFKTELFDFVLEHQRIKPLSFVYEWPFDMIRASANCVLEVNTIADDFGYETIDAHPFNIVFEGCHPVFIDLGSFSQKDKQAIQWRAIDEFKSFYLFPLLLWKKVSYLMARRIYSDPSVLSKEEFQQLIDLKIPHLIRRIIAYLFRLKNAVHRRIRPVKSRKELLNRLRLSMKALPLPANSTPWAAYQECYNPKVDSGVSTRFRFIIDKFIELNIKTVTELASNQGVLTYHLCKDADVGQAVCVDYDTTSMNVCFNFFQNSKFGKQVSPVLMDFMRPVEIYTSGKPSERFRSEAVVAMAVTHHLTLSQGFDLNSIMETLAGYTSRYAFIEFMPLGLWNGKTALPIPDWYTKDWFEKSFSRYFEILNCGEIEENRILYIGTLKPLSEEKSELYTSQRSLVNG